MPESQKTLHVYGIRNCDTVRAALKWLEAAICPTCFMTSERNDRPLNN